MRGIYVENKITKDKARSNNIANKYLFLEFLCVKL